MKQEAGRKPTWHEKFTIVSEGDNILNVKVMDEDEVTDDEVGAGSIDLNQFINEQGPVESISIVILEFVSLKFNKKPAGKVLLRVQSIGNHPKPNNMMQQGFRQQNAYQSYQPHPNLNYSSPQNQISHSQNYNKSVNVPPQSTYQVSSTHNMPAYQTGIPSKSYQAPIQTTQSHHLNSYQPQQIKKY